MDEYIPFVEPSFLELKKKLLERISTCANDIKESSDTIHSMTFEELKEKFNAIEDDVDHNKDLTSESIFIICYVLLERFIVRLESNDFSEYYELSSLIEISTEDDLSDMQRSWIVLIEGNRYMDRNALNRRFNRYGESLYNRYSRLATCYNRGDILDPKRTKYTLDYYVRLAKDMENAGAHILAIKDMSGLLKPYAAKELVGEENDV